METNEINTRWPEFNRAQKQYSPVLGIACYCDQTGFKRLALKQLKNKREPAIFVASVMEGHELLRGLFTEYELCLRLSGIPKDKFPSHPPQGLDELYPFKKNEDIYNHGKYIDRIKAILFPLCLIQKLKSL